MGTRFSVPARLEESPGPILGGFVRRLPGVRVNTVDPAVSERQRRFMGAELGRRRRGLRTRTGMSESQLREFARRRR